MNYAINSLIRPIQATPTIYFFGDYNSYLQWKTKKQKSDMDKFQNVIDMTGYKYTSLCRICEKLATDIPE